MQRKSYLYNCWKVKKCAKDSIRIYSPAGEIQVKHLLAQIELIKKQTLEIDKNRDVLRPK